MWGREQHTENCLNSSLSRFRAVIQAMCFKHMMMTTQYVEQHHLKTHLRDSITLLMKDQPGDPIRAIAQYFTDVADGKVKLVLSSAEDPSGNAQQDKGKQETEAELDAARLVEQLFADDSPANLEGGGVKRRRSFSTPAKTTQLTAATPSSPASQSLVNMSAHSSKVAAQKSDPSAKSSNKNARLIQQTGLMRELHSSFSRRGRMELHQWIRLCQMFFVGWHEFRVSDGIKIFHEISGAGAVISFGTLQMALSAVARCMYITPAEVVARLLQTSLPMKFGLFIEGDEEFVREALGEQYDNACKGGKGGMHYVHFLHVCSKAGLVGGSIGLTVSDLNYLFFRHIHGEKVMSRKQFLSIIPMLFDHLHKVLKAKKGEENDCMGYRQVAAALAFQGQAEVFENVELDKSAQFEASVQCYQDFLES
eukprot:GEMP01032804.1.p1 GENE.GEMP01032804.1~~GEMP01032804.1.p1  ORF type:complete len:422 (+),score=64.44 GEMP01032804.1:232-1497(+)